MKVGDGFYVFQGQLLGKGYELQKRWITEVRPGHVRHIGGATDCGDRTTPWPLRGNPDPKKAFEKGKARAVIGALDAEKELRKKLKDLVQERRKLQALKFENVPQRGNGVTFEQFKRQWDCDF